MLRGGKEEKTTEEEIEAQLILEEVLREGRGERDEIGEREGELFFKNVSLLLLILLSSLFLPINNSNQTFPLKKKNGTNTLGGIAKKIFICDIKK